MTALYGLIGRTLSHSFSADLFAAKFRDEGIDARYELWELPDIANITDKVLSLPGLRGFNVTIPYKRAIIPYLDEVSDEAGRIGAVNVVKVRRSPAGEVTLKGYNTDCRGFAGSVLPFLSDETLFRRALVLGTGGAAQAVKYALEQLGLGVEMVSRRPRGRRGIVGYPRLRDEEFMDARRLIVNATPLGTAPDTDRCPDIPYRLIGGGHLCVDLVYNPEVTEFMRRCAARGATVRNGLEMLRLQALEAWRIWQE